MNIDTIEMKGKLLKQTIARINKRLTKINQILQSNPFAEIHRIRMEANKLLHKNNSLSNRSDEFLDKMERLAIEEEKQCEILNKLKDSDLLLIEKNTLEKQLKELMFEVETLKNKDK
jgi:hypothetical protein